jgi:hypothetical protein
MHEYESSVRLIKGESHSVINAKFLVNKCIQSNQQIKDLINNKNTKNTIQTFSLSRE